MRNHVNAFVLVLNLIVLHSQAALTSSLTSYLTLTPADYTFNLTFSPLTIPSGATPIIFFSNRYSITLASINACSFLNSANTTYNSATCSVTSNSSSTTVVFSGVYSSAATNQSSLSLKFSISNPWAATTESYSVAIVSGGSNVTSDTATITYSASPLRDCVWISSSDVNGAVGTRRVSFVPSVSVIENSYLSISVPFWFGSLMNLAVSSPTCTAISNVNSGVTCSNTTNGAYQVYQASNIFTSNGSLPGTVELNISSIKNPWSTYPFGPISYSLVYSPAGTAYVSQSCSGITQRATSISSMVSFGISFFSFISFTSSLRTGWFKINNPLPATGGELHITWNGGVSISVTPTGTPSLLFLNSSYLILASFSSDYYPNSNISVFNRFNVVAPRSSRPFTITATTYYSSGGVSYGIDSRTNSYACSAGSFSSVSLLIGSTAIGATTWLQVSLRLQNAVYSGSFMGVTFPVEMKVSGVCSTNVTGIGCSIRNNTYANLTVTATISAATAIKITFSTVTNPGQALTSSSFSILSYIDGLFDGIIDQTASGLTLTFSAAPLPSNRLFVLPSNLTTHASANYTVSVTLDNPIPNNGSILVIFPTQITITAPTLLDASFNASLCSLSLSMSNLTLNNCFPTGLSTLSLYLVVGGAANPPSLAPTDPFQLYTSGTTGTVDYLVNGPTVTMTQLAVSDSLSIGISSTEVHANAIYTISIIFYSTPSASHYLLLSLPATMSVSPVVSCNPISGVASVSCLRVNQTNLKVVMVAVPAKSIAFSVSTIQNDQVAWTVSLKMVIYNAQDYATEQTPSTSLTFTPTILAATSTLNDQFVLYKPSNFTLLVTAPFSLSNSLNVSATQLFLSIPSEFSTHPNSTCRTGNVSCSQSNASTFVLQGVGLTLSAKAVTFQNLVPNYNLTSSSFTISYLYSNSIVGLISNLTIGIYCSSPCQQCLNTTTSCLSCLPSPNTLTLFFHLNSSCLSSCPDGYYPAAGICNSCLPSCATCNSSSTCLTCATGYFSFNSTCTNVCPSSSYLVNSTCQPCDIPCATCNTSATFCLTCLSPSLQHLGTCVATCPNGTYNNNGSCSACNSSCQTCTWEDNCSSCSAPYYLNAQSCHSNCSSGNLANPLTRTCDPCAANCTSCENNTNICTTCFSTSLFFNYSCLISCPSNYFNVSGQCVTCSHCLICISPVLCSQCLPSYYLFEAGCYSVCPSSAPVADPVNMLCSKCGNQCLNCNVEATYCYSCASSYFSLQGKCYSSCPAGYNPDYATGSCKKQKQITLVYAPVSLAAGSFLIIVAVSKFLHPISDFVGNAAALTTIAAMVSAVLLTAQVQQDETLIAEARLLTSIEEPILENFSTRLLAISADKTTALIALLASLLASLVVGTVYVAWFCCRLYSDPGLKLWREKSSINRYALNTILALSCVRVGAIRAAYSRWFGRQCFSCYLRANTLLLKGTNFFTITAIGLVTAPSMCISLILLTNSLGQTQTKIYALDCLIVSSFEFVALVLDMCRRDKAHFAAILTDLPYLRKFRKYQDLESSDGSLISIQEPQEQHPKTEADANLQPLSLGAFGTFSEDSSHHRASIVKTLPEHSNLNIEVSFDPYEEKRRNDELFFQEREYTNKFKELKQSYQKEEEGEGINEDADQHTEHQNWNLPKTVQQIIRQLPSNNIKTVEELIKQKPREVDPAEYLKQASPEDYQPIAPKDTQYLEEMAERHGLDKAFVKDTFGVKKHFNPTLLSKAIDYHSIFSSSVQKLINPNNSQEALQQVLGRDSKTSPQALKALLQDQKNGKIIQSLFGKQSSLFHPKTLEEILSKFTPDYLGKLLEESVDRNKLAALLSSCRQNQGETQALKALQQIGGYQLQDNPILQNVIGPESELDPTLIPKVAAEMSPKSRANIFGRKSHANSTMIRKIINNKSIRLQPLNPIQQIPQIVEQFAQLLNCGNEKVERDLTQVLQEGNYDGEQLKQLVSQAGNSQQEMGKLLNYINEHKSKKNKSQKQQMEKLQSPFEVWPQTPDILQQEQESYLDFDIDQSQSRATASKAQHSHLYPFETESRQSRVQKLERPRLRRKEVPHIHLPSEHIYLQRIQGPHEAQRRKNIRTKKKKGEKLAQKFMDEDNEIYDLDF